MKKVLVIGDVVFDEYVTCDIHGLTLEAPALVGTSRKETRNIGAAGNIVRNLESLGVEVDLVTVFSPVDEPDFNQIAGDHKTFNLSAFFPSHRIRRMRRYVDQRQSIIFRVDSPLRDYGNYTAEFWSDAYFMLNHYNNNYDAVVVAEYLETPLVRSILPLLEKVTIPIIANIRPCKHASKLASLASIVSVNFSEFVALADNVIPNLPDLTLTEITDNELRQISTIVGGKTTTFLVTADKYGCVLVSGDSVVRFPVVPVEVDNPCGAGDTFLAAFVSVMDELPEFDAIEFAQAAARVSVQHYETYAPTKLEVDLELAEVRAKSKILREDQVEQVARELHSQGLSIVVTNGCFDLLHMGHKSLLDFSRQQGDKLVVLVNTDETIRKLKGVNRPIQPLASRLNTLTYLPCVDYVAPFSDDTPDKLIRWLKPDVLVKGREYIDTEVPGADYVIKNGGKLLFAPMYDDAKLHTSTLVS